ncbi:MAG: HAD family phosphatase [Bacteroides sp.]|nr:HAD family phosphatase [Bacteroides sp.]
MRFKNIVFDFGGVLVDLNRPRCIDHFLRLGVTDIGSMLDACHQQGIFHCLDEGTITTDEFHAEIRRRTAIPVTDDEIDAAWYTFLEGIPAYKLDALLELKEHYHVHLLSNVSDLHWQWSCKHLFSYQGHRVEDFFERIYLSYRLKMTKPNPAVFRTMLEDSGMVPEETLFIDDAPDNCRVARSFDITTYTPKAREDWRKVLKEELLQGFNG